MKMKTTILVIFLTLTAQTVFSKDLIYQWQLSKFPHHLGVLPQTFLTDPYKSAKDPKTDETLLLWQLKEFDKLSKDEAVLSLLNEFKPSTKIQSGEDILQWQLKDFKKTLDDLKPETTFKEYNRKKLPNNFFEFFPRKSPTKRTSRTKSI